MANTLRDLFLASVEKAPDHCFLSDTDQDVTYTTALQAACLRAGILQKYGARPQDRVLIIDKDPLETVLWLLACCLSGVVFAILHRDTSEMRLQVVLRDIEPIGVIDLQTVYGHIYQMQPSLRFVYSSCNLLDPALNTQMPDVTLLETDPACFIYTSGSTGSPKGVICQHRAIIAVTSSINGYLPNSSDDRIAHLLSLSFTYGLSQIFLAIQVQATIVFLRKQGSIVDIFSSFDTLGITAFPAIRPLLVSLTRLTRAHFQLHRLKYITNAGDSLPPSITYKLLDDLPHVQVFSMYGLSECSRALYMSPERLRSKPDSVGRPIPGTRVYIVNDKGETLLPGEVGELIVEGPHVMSGYWKSPEETALKFFQGIYGEPQLRTGDLFRQDSEGDFYFISRMSNLIKCRGIRISPREVESAILMADPSVRECIVYGVEDDVAGQAIHAEVIVEHSSHTVSHVFSRCRAAMEPYMVPTKITIVDNFSTTISGKYHRHPG